MFQQYTHFHSSLMPRSLGTWPPTECFFSIFYKECANIYA
nr:MAG TPA: hypothetical protein [Caudoviricetes sp.]